MIAFKSLSPPTSWRSPTPGHSTKRRKTESPSETLRTLSLSGPPSSPVAISSRIAKTPVVARVNTSIENVSFEVDCKDQGKGNIVESPKNFSATQYSGFELQPKECFSGTEESLSTPVNQVQIGNTTFRVVDEVIIPPGTLSSVQQTSPLGGVCLYPRPTPTTSSEKSIGPNLCPQLSLSRKPLSTGAVHNLSAISTEFFSEEEEVFQSVYQQDSGDSLPSLVDGSDLTQNRFGLSSVDFQDPLRGFGRQSGGGSKHHYFDGHIPISPPPFDLPGQEYFRPDEEE